MTVYRSASVTAYVAAARDRLAAHTADPATGHCARCGGNAPCLSAHDAARQLAELAPPAAPLLTAAWRRLPRTARAGRR